MNDKYVVIDAIAQNLSPNTRDKVMTIAEQFKQEGRQEGYQEGANQEKHHIASNMLSKGYPISDIIDMTGLSLEEIQKLKADTQH